MVRYRPILVAINNEATTAPPIHTRPFIKH